MLKPRNRVFIPVRGTQFDIICRKIFHRNNKHTLDLSRNTFEVLQSELQLFKDKYKLITLKSYQDDQNLRFASKYHFW